MIEQLKEPVSPRRAMAVVAVLAGALGILWGGWELYVRLAKRPPSPAAVKKQIWSYLEKETGTKDFTAGLDVSSITNQKLTVTITNRAGRVKEVSRPMRRNRLGLPETTLSAYFRTNHAEAPTYERMYRLVGEQLRIADELLESEETLRQFSALIMAGEASHYARNSAMNVWLSARICEAYLWPNVSLLENTNATALTAETVLNLCDAAFKEASETNNIIRNYEYLIATSDRRQADQARFRLARLYEDAGEDVKALACLKEITTFNNRRVDQQIAALEGRLKQKR